MRLFQKKPAAPLYDAEKLIPVIHGSICTRERAAGFKDRETGQFHEIMLIQNEKDLEAFRKRFGIEGPIQKDY